MIHTPKIFITGANGFVGSNLIKTLGEKHISFVAGSREVYGDITTQKNWEVLLSGCDVVVHLAARVHVMEETSLDPLVAFRKMNVEASVNLARASKLAGVKRFIYISSIKVNGEETFEKPFLASDPPAPLDPYGISKMEAENELLALHEKGVFEVVIIRPPLVYGPGVKANFEKLFWLVKKDLPLPFGLVKNIRSLVSVFNLVDLIILCSTHEKAGGEIFLVSDGVDYSLKDLIVLMAKVEGKTPHLLPIPTGLMKFGATLIGKKTYANRLFGNLHVDIKKTQSLLDWNPPHTFLSTFGCQQT
ncbi:MAG: SDR family oxidoreductase [Bacteriovoracaceae bacterium]|nr:SDR family oxidoreductase [Bacteriovoracaceae bacterium]